jgi:opacity protein-like surface antigen
VFSLKKEITMKKLTLFFASIVALPFTASAAEIVETQTLTAPMTQPEPYTGWRQGKRAPMYVNFMMLGGGFVEDSGNRLTTRDSRTLEGAGCAFRIGAVVDEHHRIGARFQSFMRPTRKIVRDQPLPAGTVAEWGGAQFISAGPEYIFSLPNGFYAGASLGLGMAFTTKSLEKDHDDSKEDIEHGAAGFSGILSVGYEWRVSKWFALNGEAYGGFFRGVDDDERDMTNAHFGLGMGVGF